MHRHASLIARICALTLVWALLASSVATGAPAAFSSDDPPTVTDVAPAVPPTYLPGQTPALGEVFDPANPLASIDASPSIDATSLLAIDLDEVTEEFREELRSKQIDLEAFLEQLDGLDRELSVAAEAYNAARLKLDATREQLAQTEQDLQNATDAYEVQSRLLAARASTIYRDGELSALELLVSSTSFGDLIKRLEFLGVIGTNDAALARQMRSQRDSIVVAVEELKVAKAQAEALEFDLRARRIEIELRIEERQALLETLRDDILDMLVREAERRREMQADLMQQILSGAEGIGIQVVPGTPVETALAYHGIPYLWGGETPAGMDCSGLVLYVFRQHGVQLPHYSGSQFLLGTPVEPWDLQAGDVVFFGSPIHHVGIYLGGGYYLHAPRTGDFIKVSRLADRSDYAGARRYPWAPRLDPIEGVSQIDESRLNHDRGVDLHSAIQ